MYTPQQQTKQQWSVSANRKGKSVVMAEQSTLRPSLWPPRDSPMEDERENGGSEATDWRRFREAGLLDESQMRRKEREGFLDRISDLERELRDYQETMGLIIMERDKFSRENEELKQGILEAQEMLKREQASNLVAITEFQRKEESLRYALVLEKQCVTDLEKALREVNSEIDNIKSKSDKKLAEAESLESSLQEKKLEIERKAHFLDAKLSETSLKNSQANRKLEDVESLERKLQKEKLLFDTERKLSEKNIAEREENLRNWEIRLQEGQNRLFERQLSLNEREDRVNEREWNLKKKQEGLEEMERTVESMNDSIKLTEEDIKTRMRVLSEREKDMESRDANQVEKEREFVTREENLCHRELELEIKMNKLKDLETDLESKSRALKNWEESVKNKEEKLNIKQEELAQETKRLDALKSELDSLNRSLEDEKVQILRERESATLTKEEREQHLVLKSQLEREIDKQRALNDSICKEIEDLKVQKRSFEREWELLDEKRTVLNGEHEKLNEERESLESWSQTEQHRLKSMELELASKFESKMEELRTHEESLNNRIQLERNELEEQQINFKKQIELETEQIKKDKELFLAEKQKSESDRAEIARDVDSLTDLSLKLRDQREELIRERDRLLSLAEQFRSCKNCGVTLLNESNLHSINPSSIPFPKLNFESGSIIPRVAPSPNPNNSSGANMSWLKKCTTRLLNFSPSKTTEVYSDNEIVDISERLDTVSRQIVSTNQNEESNIQTLSTNQNEETETESSLLTTPDSKIKKIGQNKRKGSKNVRRTHSVRDVVEESKAIFGVESETNGNDTKGRKRLLSETINEESEGQSESLSIGGGGRSRKKRQTSVQNAVEKRYNFRRSTIAKIAGPQSAAEEEILKQSENEITNKDDNESNRGGEKISKPEISEEIPEFEAKETEAAPTERNNEIVEITEQQIIEDEIMVEREAEEQNNFNDVSTPTNNGFESEDSEEFEEESNKSIGKKIWNFLTS